jgi:hypothetical protein
MLLIESIKDTGKLIFNSNHLSEYFIAKEESFEVTESSINFMLLSKLKKLNPWLS